MPFTGRLPGGAGVPMGMSWTNSPIYHAYRSYRHRWKEQVINIAALGDLCTGSTTRPEWNGSLTVNEERRSAELQRMPQITDISALWTPDAKVLCNHTCLHSRTKSFHIGIASGGCGTQHARRLLSRRVYGLWARSFHVRGPSGGE
ncbi:uncharacterized protein [Drosophila pseudoobscura]|uniref:Uncharacterized protein n=1 Tax=Drosophila pseudoobscura pseudoobscura TaxID=46245 RepID=A0A6I8VH99_DROPS|nr:uncharacterized protein LOC26532021 [Drosophila pseudoobscura]